MINRTILDGGINWNWYFNADFDDITKQCHVRYYERWHKYDSDKHPVSEYPKQFSKVEDSNRILQSIKLNGVEYTVINPCYIFNYKDFSTLVME